ncbi:MAG: phosphoenolpyruvate--protein phosphotransferase [Puniceicoccales bacterium]|jgi:phosphotransferase system enzyme I (PtsI)|nr:phosphoenolpyruvate--protein phosphotransferase [Puniceicoccales bacterium]
MSVSHAKPEMMLRGIAASPGVAQGPAFVFLQQALDVPCYQVSPEKMHEEGKRFESALLETRKQISQLRSAIADRLGEGEAAIFDAHLLVLDDPALIDETLKTMHSTGFNIEHSFHMVAERYIAFFSKLDDEYFKERVGDIRDVSVRILHNMLGLSRRTLAEVTESCVIIAEDLTPSDTANLHSGHALAFVTEGGNRTSHAVIMARASKIPSVVGVASVTEQVTRDDYILVDGYEGVVYVNPSPVTLERYQKIQYKHGEFQEKVFGEVTLPNVTADGVPFKLSANVGSVEDVQIMAHVHAGGVGLFRTENVFLKHPNRVPDEETQFQAYKSLVEAVLPDRVIVRTLDIGGDKQHGILMSGESKEQNPFMGFRAIRFCLENKDYFRTQLRAILRASAFGRVKIMFPMISSLDELLQAKAFLKQVAGELEAEGVDFDKNIPVGAMIEIPSAAIASELLADQCDFFSIGTNDLIQYLLAVDRGNERIAHLYEPCNPAVLYILRYVISMAKRKKIEVSVCGELAGDPSFAPLLYALGADSLSMAPAVIPEIRYLLRRTTRADLDALVKDVYAETDARKIGEILRNFYTMRLI